MLNKSAMHGIVRLQKASHSKIPFKCVKMSTSWFSDQTERPVNVGQVRLYKYLLCFILALVH